MPAHDIIDNRKERLIDHFGQMLNSSELARFAIGCLFLSGLTSVAKRLLEEGDVVENKHLSSDQQ